MKTYRILYFILYNHGKRGRLGPNIVYSSGQTDEEARANALPKLQQAMDYAQEIHRYSHNLPTVHTRIVSVTKIDNTLVSLLQ